MRNLLRALGTSALAALLAVGASADTIHMKNGSVIRGKVLGFSNGEFTVLLDDGAGGSRSRAMLAEDEIDRIEFDEERGAPVDTSAPPAGRPAPRRDDPGQIATRDDGSVTAPVSDSYDTAPSPADVVVRQGDVNVAPQVDWTNTQFRVERGSRVRITASGSVKLDPTGRNVATPAGLNTPDRDKLMPTRPTGGLIAVIGDDNDDFIYVGSQAQFVAERSGYLFLSVNEGNLRDNTGSFRAHVVVEPPQGGAAAARRTGGISGRNIPPASTTARRAPAERPAPAARRDPDPVRPAPSSQPRRAEPSVPPASTSRAPAGSIPAGTVIRESEVTVQPNIDWTNTRLRVDRGNVVRVAASGSVRLDSAGRRVVGPAGIEAADADKLMPNQPTGGLVAVIGDDNDEFIFVGSEGQFVAERSGVLFLSVNEGNLRDNSGSFTARVAIEQARVASPSPATGAPARPAGRPADESSQPAGSLPPPVVGDGTQGGAPSAPAPQRPAAPQIGPSGGQAELVIQAKSDWTSTQIVVKKGMRIRISATGSVKLDAAGGPVTPAGGAKADPHKLMGNRPTGALVAVIGDDNNDYIFVGPQTEFVAQRDGILFLGINEGELSDNSGFFTVRITVEPARR